MDENKTFELRTSLYFLVMSCQGKQNAVQRCESMTRYAQVAHWLRLRLRLRLNKTSFRPASTTLGIVLLLCLSSSSSSSDCSPPLIVVLFNSMESQSELVGGGQTIQPLVANQNDQNVKSPVATKRARNPGKDKKHRAKKKQKAEDTERQLENVRADYAELKKTYDELKNTHAYSNGKLDQAKEDMELIKGCFSLWQQVVTQQHAWINMLQPPLVAGMINQFGATMEPGGPVLEESLPQSQEWAHGNNSEQPTSYNADQFPGVN